MFLYKLNMNFVKDKIFKNTSWNEFNFYSNFNVQIEILILK